MTCEICGLVEVTLTKCPTRAGLEITLEANRSRFLLECQVGFELPRTVLRRMSFDVGLMLTQALAQIVGGADVEMTGEKHGLSAKGSKRLRILRSVAMPLKSKSGKS